MPIVNPEMVTAADLVTYQCPKCSRTFRDFTKYQCEECERKFWNEITLNPDWFPKKLEDGSPDWNSVKKDKPLFSNEWSYGRLNIKTMEMEKVPIDREGKKWDYLNYQISSVIEEKKIENAAMQRVNGSKKTPSQIKKEIKLEKDIEKRDIQANKEEKELTIEEKEKDKG